MYRFRSVVVLAVVLVVSLLGLASGLVLNRVTKDAQASLGQSLSMVLETTHQAVKSWVSEQQTVATVWAGAREVRDAASNLLAVPPTPDALAESPVQAELRRRLSSVYAAKGYQGYVIIGPGNTNFASNYDAELGAPNLLAKQRGFLDRVWAGATAVSLPLASDVPLADGEGRPRRGGASMLAASPIRGNDGRVMAVLAFRIDPTADFSALFRQSRPGTTGETYGFDKQGRLITESRFDEQLRRIGLLPMEGRSILNIELRDPGRALTEAEPSDQSLVHRPMTAMARQAIAGRSGMDLDGYRDYRGVVVVGAWLWDKSHGLGIASEMDVSEAYAPLRTVQHVIAGLTALSALLLLVLSAAFVIYRGRIVERERRLRQIIDLVPSMIFAKDRNGRFLLANAAVADAYGTSPQAITHASHQDLHNQAAEVQAMLADDREVIDSGRTKVIPEEAFLDAYGRHRILQTVKIPYETAGRGQRAVLGVATDITARKRAEEALTRERDRAQQYLDIAGVMVVVVGADRRVSLINQKGCEVLGYEEANILGKDWFANFLPERMRAEVGRGFDSLMRGELAPMEYYENPVLTRGGEERLIAWHNTLVRGESDRILGSLSSGEDITERRKLEDRRNRFVSIASHELRTPLTNISLSLELLLREAAPEISERARGILDIARRSSERLTRVVNDLLDLQRLEAGKIFFDLKPVALLPLVQEAIASSRAYAEQFDVRYVLVSQRADVRVQGDSDGLIRVITNLLSNAARFSPAGASVDVDLSRSDPRVRVSVTDRGAGIPEDFRELVFEPFAQAEPSLEDPRHKASSGLGLSISKAIVERHGGEIGFDSQPHRATTFYFELNEWVGP